MVGWGRGVTGSSDLSLYLHSRPQVHIVRWAARVAAPILILPVCRGRKHGADMTTYDLCLLMCVPG